MGGGLLNLVSEGNKNIFLNGNPKKTFFSTKYKKYTNFGMEKIRLDVQGSRTLNMTTTSKFIFNIKNYGDLMMDTYFVLTLPNIWSPVVEILPPPNNYINLNPDCSNCWSFYGRDYMFSSFMQNKWPYEFKWIENLGSQLIKEVKYLVGGVVIQQFSGDYLLNMVHRDFSKEKKELFDEMTGNTNELNDPANYGGRRNNYPNSIFNENWLPLGPEPSIRSRKIYVPLNIWSTLNSKMAFPLISLTKQNLRIEITCRPIQELFVVRYIPTPEILNQFNEIIIRINNGRFTPSNVDIESEWNYDIRENYMQNTKYVGYYVQANQNENRYLFYRFVNPTFSPIAGADINDVSGIRFKNGTVSGTLIDAEFYELTKNIWNADAHLICNYVFLSEEERKIFKQKKQKYLVKFVDERDYFGLQGTSIIRLIKEGLVTSWMWFLQRSDVGLLNEWSNYTNWLTKKLPFKTINNLTNDYTNPNLSSLIYDILGNQQNSNSGICNRNYCYLKNFLYRFTDSANQLPYNFPYNALNSYLRTNKYLGNEFLNQFHHYECNQSEAEKLAATVGFSIINGLTLNYTYLPHCYNIGGPYHKKNEKDILKNATLLFNGKIRENSMEYNIYNKVEPYLRSNGTYKSGLLCYNFCLNTDPFSTQPSGSINLNKFSAVDMEIDLIKPEKDINAKIFKIINSNGDLIGINKNQWNIFLHTFRLHFMQERYIYLEFEDGNIIVDNLV